MIRASEVIFAVQDVRETVRFYRDILGFESEWFWQDPPSFGGARWGDVQVMFCLMPRMAGKTDGLMHMFRVDDIKSIYAKHKAAGAPIVHDLENRPWGMAEYTVRDPNGYHLRFGGVEIYERKPTATDQIPSHIRIELRSPTLEQYAHLCKSVGWSHDLPGLKQALAGSKLIVMAFDWRDGKAVGMVRVTGDARGFMIWDVIVVPEHQCQKIGSAMMETALAELRKTEPKGAFVGLFTPKPAFYERLGFKKGIGMHIGL